MTSRARQSLPDLIGTAEVIEALGISESTLRRLQRDTPRQIARPWMGLAHIVEAVRAEAAALARPA